MSSISFHSLGTSKGSQFSLEAAGCISCSRDSFNEKTRSGTSGTSVGYTGRPSLDSDDAGTEVDSFIKNRSKHRGFSLLDEDNIFDEYPEIESRLPKNKRKRAHSRSPQGKEKSREVEDDARSPSNADKKDQRGSVPNDSPTNQRNHQSPVRQAYSLPRVDENEE